MEQVGKSRPVILEDVAEGLLIGLALKMDGVDLENVAMLVTRVSEELVTIMRTHPKKWPKPSDVPLRTIVVKELGRLLRQGRLTIECDRPRLYLKLNKEKLRLASSR